MDHKNTINSQLKLKRSEEKFKQLFEFSSLGIAMIDHDTGEFLEVNQSLLNFTGYSKEEFLKLTFWDITPDKYKDQEEQQIKQLNETGRFEAIEKEYFKKDGTTVPVKLSGFSIVNEDGKKVVWGLIEDITEKKQNEIIYEDNKYLLEYIAIENSLQNILDKIVHLSELRDPHIKCSILLLDDKKQHLTIGSAPSLPKFYNDAVHGIQIGEKIGSCGSSVFKKQRVIIEDINTHENWQDYLELTQKANLHSCWSEPIISSNNEVLGTFAIYHSKIKQPNHVDIKRIEAYASIVSKAIEKYQHTKEIEDSKNKLKQLFNNAQTGLVYISEKREIVKANQRFADIFGYHTVDELTNKNLSILHIDEEKFNQFGQKHFYPLMQGEIPLVEYQLKRKDGTVIWCEMSAKTLDRDIPADLAKGVIWTISDISLRKKYEDELKKNQLLLKTILTTIPDMIWLKDLEGKYLTCNEEFEKYFGAKEEQIIGKTDYDFVDKKEADFFRAQDNRAANSLEALVNEEWITYAGQSNRRLLDTTKKAMKDNDGNIIGILGIGHNATLRKEKEDELKELNSYTQSLTKSQQVLLSLFDKGESVLFKWKIDQDLTVEYVSLSVEKLLGYKQEIFLDKKRKYSQCIKQDDLPEIIDYINYCVNEKLDYFPFKPYRVITKDNHEKWVTGYSVTQKDSKGNVTDIIGYVTDITNQKKQQEIIYHQSKMASMGEMIANIAHQWRQPLSVISTGATGMMIEKEYDKLTDERFYSICQRIDENAQYLSQTIDDFKNFIKGDARPSVFNLKNKSTSFIQLVDSTIKTYGIEVILSLEENINIKGYPNELIQCFMNLFNNAKDVLIEKPEGDRYIFISQYIEDNNLIIEFKDNAGGIEKNILPKIFEPYFTTKHKSKGTGLGLSMTYNLIVNGMGGDIKVKNTDYILNNKSYTGALFTISIPVELNL